MSYSVLFFYQQLVWKNIYVYQQTWYHYIPTESTFLLLQIILGLLKKYGKRNK